MIVKVCGVRDPEVAEVAIESGADWLGLVFEPRSPRFVDDESARRVASAVGGRADLVGVFVAPSVGVCEAAASRYGLSAVQVHGGVDPDFVSACAVPVIRGFNVHASEAALTLQWWPDCLVLLDSGAPEGELPGGTGVRLDTAVAAEVAAHRRVILAGGLGPDNVGDAILAVRPEGVDASSGLESAPGHKDPDLVRRYVRNARAAFAELTGDS
jgi:phosphoribosylanthranilate isomerase